MVMKSLASKDYVKFKFNWRWFYYFLTDKGIEYLRDVLHLPAQVFPATLTKQTRPARPGAENPAEATGGDGEKGKGKKGKLYSRSFISSFLTVAIPSIWIFDFQQCIYFHSLSNSINSR